MSFVSKVCYRQRDMNTATYTVYLQVEKTDNLRSLAVIVLERGLKHVQQCVICMM